MPLGLKNKLGLNVFSNTIPFCQPAGCDSSETKKKKSLKCFTTINITHTLYSLNENMYKEEHLVRAK